MNSMGGIIILKPLDFVPETGTMLVGLADTLILVVATVASVNVDVVVVVVAVVVEVKALQKSLGASIIET